jgi:hypothetical protein
VKKLILTLVAVGAVASSYGQGLVAWGNSAATAADNLSIKALDGTTSLTPLRTGAANTYVVALFISDTAAGLLTANPLAYGSNSPAVLGKFGGVAANAGVADGVSVYFQVRAWSLNAGVDWATVAPKIAAGTDASIWFGESTIGQVVAKAAPNTPNNIWTVVAGAGNLPIDGFTLASVPEPSTIALVGLGLAGLVFIRRRK